MNSQGRLQLSGQDVRSLQTEWHTPIKRWTGIIAGVAVHMLFAVTVWYLFWFLKGTVQMTSQEYVWFDLALSLQFAIPHSLLLHPWTRKRVSHWIAAPFYGLFFCAVTCASLLLTIACWKTSEATLWDLQGTSNTVVQIGFVLSWIALFYSLYISGLGYQTGLTPWLEWVNHQSPAPRRFEEKSLYRWFRHPIYLSFLGLIWFTPKMTYDHAILTAVWTIYIFVGSWLKDRRLEFYAGEHYREYESRVPGYPLMTWGPLGLKRLLPMELTSVRSPEHEVSR